MSTTPAPQTPPPSLLRGILTGASVLLVLAALLLLYSYPLEPADTYIIPAIILIVLGVGLFLWNRARPARPTDARSSAPTSAAGSALWISAAVVFGILAAVMMVLFQKYERQNYIPVLSMWLGAAACYLTAFLRGRPDRAALREWARAHGRELLLVAGITALAAALRFYKLGEIPRVINGDEGWLGNLALTTIRPPYANPFALWENFGALYLQIVNWGFIFFGTSAFSLRLAPAVAGTLAIPALYLFSRQVAGRRVAALAAFLLAISHTHINFSRTVGVGYIQDTWLVPLELYLLLSGLQKRSRARAAVGGLLMGIHFSIYLTPQIFAAMLAVFCLLVLLFFRRRFEQPLRTIATFWGGLAVMILPESVFAATHANEFFNRLNTDGTFQSGWLAQQMAATGQSSAQILVGRVAHVFLSLIYYPALDFYGSPVSVLSLFTGVLFLVGMGYALWKTRSIEMLLLNGYFWVGPIAIGIFSIPESADSYRVLMILPAAMLMAAIGLDSILEAMGLAWGRKRLVYAGVTGFLLMNLFVFNQWAYFVDFAGKCRYGMDPQTRFASYLGKYLGTLAPLDPAFLLSNDVYRFGTHPSAEFLSGGKTALNVPDAIDTLAPVSGDILIAAPDRIEELLAWARAHPGGKLDAFYDCQTLFLVAYHVP
jgi:4-amino-4-deoxy-L-arabinose transferase-like glycosyltransferase